MSAAFLPDVPDAADFRALAASSPWRFTTMHFTHRRQGNGGATAEGGPVEAWLDRSRHRVVVRTTGGVEVAEGVPYSGSVSRADSELFASQVGVVLRSDGLVAQRPEDWHLDHGDPMWLGTYRGRARRSLSGGGGRRGGHQCSGTGADHGERPARRGG